LPTFSKKDNEIKFDGMRWEAKSNPLETDILDILTSWEKDFNDALVEAKKKKDQFSS